MQNFLVRLFVALVVAVSLANGQNSERSKKLAAQVQAQEAIENGVSVFYAPASRCLLIMSEYGSNDTNSSAVAEEILSACRAGDWMGLVRACSKVVRKYPVYSGVMLFALAFCAVMPFAFILWCSARYCCKRCSYYLDNEMDSRHAGTKRCCCSTLLLLIVVTMTACVVLGLLASVALGDRIKTSSTKDSAPQKAGIVAAKSTRSPSTTVSSVSSSGKQRQAAVVGSGSGVGTIQGSLVNAFASWQRFAAGLLQKLNNTDALVDQVVQLAVSDVLSRAADELVTMVTPLTNAAQVAQQVGTNLRNVQLSKLKLIRAFVSNVSTSLGSVHQQAADACSSSVTTACRVAAEVIKFNASFSRLADAATLLRRYDEQQHEPSDFFANVLTGERLRDTVRSKLLNSTIRSKLDGEFSSVRISLRQAIVSMRSTLNSVFSAVNGLTQTSSSNLPVDEMEQGRSIVTFAVLGSAGFVCLVLYVALGFGVWGQRALPAERDELDDREVEHCCNRSRAASHAAFGAACLFPVGTCVTFVAVAYLTVAFFAQTELCTASNSSSSDASCLPASPPTTSFLDAVLDLAARSDGNRSPYLSVQVPDLALNATITLSPANFIRSCASPSRAVLDAAAQGLRCELESAMDVWLSRLFRRWPPANSTIESIVSLSVFDNMTSSFESEAFADLMRALSEMSSRTNVHAELRDMVSLATSWLRTSRDVDGLLVSLRKLNDTLDAYATLDNNVTAALITLAATNLTELNQVWRRDVLMPLTSIKLALPKASALGAVLAKSNVTRDLSQVLAQTIVMAFGNCEHFAAGWQSARDAFCVVALPPLNALWFALGVLALLIIPSLVFSLRLNQLWRKRYAYGDDRAPQSSVPYDFEDDQDLLTTSFYSERHRYAPSPTPAQASGRGSGNGGSRRQHQHQHQHQHQSRASGSSKGGRHGYGYGVSQSARVPDYDYADAPFAYVAVSSSSSTANGMSAAGARLSSQPIYAAPPTYQQLVALNARHVHG